MVTDSFIISNYQICYTFIVKVSSKSDQIPLKLDISTELLVNFNLK